MLESLGVLTFVSHFISCVCIPAVSCSLPKYFKLKSPVQGIQKIGSHGVSDTSNQILKFCVC